MIGGCWIKQEFIDADAEESVLDLHNQLDWIDHDQLKGIEHTGFGEFYKACWAEEGVEVGLQYINDEDIPKVIDRINEYNKISNKQNIIRLFGFSLNPETKKYALVTYFENVEFLEQHLKENTLDLNEKLHIIRQIVIILKDLHENHISIIGFSSRNFLICTNDHHVMFSIFTDLEREYSITYTVPEILQESRRRNDQSSDIHTLGMILCEIIFEQETCDIVNDLRWKFLQDIQDIQDTLDRANPSNSPKLRESILSHYKREPQTNIHVSHPEQQLKPNHDYESNEIRVLKQLKNRKEEAFSVHKSNTVCVKKDKKKPMESDRETSDITKAKQNKKIEVNTAETSELQNDKTNHDDSGEFDSNNNNEADVCNTARVKKAKRKQTESDRETNDITKDKQNKKTKVNKAEISKLPNQKHDDSGKFDSNNNDEADVCNTSVKNAKRKQMESDRETNDITKAKQNKKTKVNTMEISRSTNDKAKRKRNDFEVKRKALNKKSSESENAKTKLTHSSSAYLHHDDNGKKVYLEPKAGKAVTFSAADINTKHVKNQTSNENFFKDSKKPDKNSPVEKFNKHEIKQTSEPPNKREKEKRKVESAKEEHCSEENCYDGQVVNSRVESAELFYDRGDNPKTLKSRKQGQVANKINEDAKLPEPPASHSHVQPAANKTSKSQNEFEKVSELKNVIKQIREDYIKDLENEDLEIRQCATAMYFIDQLALRVGHGKRKKKENEVDTVGCCTLRLEHIRLESPNIVHFDFLGKRSIRYKNTVEVEDQVYRNLYDFKRQSKNEKDLLFNKINANKVNKYIKKRGKGLRAKDFRTHFASFMFQFLLEKYTPVNGSEKDKIKAYRRADNSVAFLLNHKRTVMNRTKNKGRSAVSKSTRDIKETNTKNSRLYYIDPCISVDWCHKNEVGIEKVFTKSLRDRFEWAITKEK